MRCTMRPKGCADVVQDAADRLRAARRVERGTARGIGENFICAIGRWGEGDHPGVAGHLDKCSLSQQQAEKEDFRKRENQKHH